MTSTPGSTSSAQPFMPREYQKTAIKYLLEHACAGLFLKPGLGKTSTTLAALTLLKKQGLIEKTLVIAPLRPCYTVWPREIAKWADFSHLRIEVLHGPDKEAALKRDADIYVINPEGLDWLLGARKARSATGRLSVGVDMVRWKNLRFDVLVIDELSKFKHHQTSRFKALKNVLGTFGRRWGLTGSPSANGLMDLFGQMYVLDEGRSLGPYITRFRDTYFIPDKYGYNWKLKPGAEDQIYERIEPLVLQMGTELLDMPDLITNNIFVEMPDAAMQVYLSLEKDFITAIDNKLVSAATAAAASIKLRQVSNGGIFLDSDIASTGLQVPKSGREWAHLHLEKVDALRDLVGELQGDPLLVAYDFAHDLDRLRNAFPAKSGAVFACDYSVKKFAELENRWNRGDIPVLFGHPQSIGHGLNLQGASSNVCWHSMTWNRELYDQFVGRVWRQGNDKKKVIVHHILAAHTIDQVMMTAIEMKGSVEQALFDGLKKMAAERSAR